MSKKEKVLNVIFEEEHDDFKTPTMDSPASDYLLPFEKPAEYFGSDEIVAKFIKEVEKVVRKHKFYKAYIAYLVEVVGLRTCQVLSNIEEDEDSKKKKVTIELHHGPMLTLFDVTYIILNYMVLTGEKITTLSVASQVLEAHRLNMVGVVRLSKTVHEQVHAENIYLHHKQGFGDVGAFLKRYHIALSPSIINKINQYLAWCEENHSMDSDVLAIADEMRIWGENQYLINK